MEKSKFKEILVPIAVIPRSMILRPMAFKHGDVEAQFWGVFGKKDGTEENETVWCATFFDRDEAEAWLQGNMHFGRPVAGAVLPGIGLEPKVKDDSTRIGSGNTPENPS